MNLTAQQETFCLEYARTGNQRQAYITAGYKCNTDGSADAGASRLLKNVKVQERLAELTEEIKNASIADITEMQQTLTSIIRQKLDEEVVVACYEGNMSQPMKLRKKPAIKDVINAINTLGKMQGAFIDRVDLTGEAKVVIVDDIEND